MRRGFLVVLLVLAVLAVAAWAADNSGGAAQMRIEKKSAAKFMTPPGLPACTSMAVDNGDPMSGASTLLIKAGSGCVIPYHWHTANETLLIVGGASKVEMKEGGKASALAAGDYTYLPAKQAHQFTCTTACTFFLHSDAKFDMHYVDQAGNEIPPEQALKAGGHGKKAAMAKAKK